MRIKLISLGTALAIAVFACRVRIDESDAKALENEEDLASWECVADGVAENDRKSFHEPFITINQNTNKYGLFFAGGHYHRGFADSHTSTSDFFGGSRTYTFEVASFIATGNDVFAKDQFAFTVNHDKTSSLKIKWTDSKMNTVKYSCQRSNNHDALRLDKVKFW